MTNQEYVVKRKGQKRARRWKKEKRKRERREEKGERIETRKKGGKQDHSSRESKIYISFVSEYCITGRARVGAD